MTEQTKEQILAALPPLPMHPEPRSFAWSKLEEAAIAGYGKACALGALSHPKSIEADSDVIANGDPSAWQIKYARVDGTSRTVVHEHNAIGDYRLIDPSATSTPLYAAPVVPAPGADAKLWCVNVIGPDDVYATRTRLEALEEANRQNIYLSGLERHEYDPVLHAVVIEWPHSASSHADDLRSGVPTATTATQPQAAPVAQLSEPPEGESK